MTSLAPCADCGTDTLEGFPGARSEFYMVHDSVWQQAGAPKLGCELCVGCLESRLGRRLHRGDFTKAPINSLVVSDTRYAWSWRSRRLRDRMTAPDPVRDGVQLPLWEGAQP
jgi:hypothetical protein